MKPSSPFSPGARPGPRRRHDDPPVESLREELDRLERLQTLVHALLPGAGLVLIGLVWVVWGLAHC